VEYNIEIDEMIMRRAGKVSYIHVFEIILQKMRDYARFQIFEMMKVKSMTSSL
jgi:hypothetical protein